MVTGADAKDDAEEGAQAPARAKGLDAKKPICVYVCDNDDSDEQKKLETLTFKAEKVALAMKAYRTVRMDSAQIAADPLLADQGKESPRLLLINPVDGKVHVLEKNKLSAAAIFNALENVSDKFYVQRLEKTVKSHLELLTDQDQLANRAKQLNLDLARAGEKDDAKAKKEIAEIQADLEAVQKQLSELTAKQAELWKLSPKLEAAPV